jgi:hypothetical protein
LAAGGAAARQAWQGAERQARRAHGTLGRTWPSGAMGLGVMLMLLAFLLSYYVIPGL